MKKKYLVPAAAAAAALALLAAALLWYGRSRAFRAVFPLSGSVGVACQAQWTPEKGQGYARDLTGEQTGQVLGALKGQQLRRRYGDLLPWGGAEPVTSSMGDSLLLTFRDRSGTACELLFLGDRMWLHDWQFAALVSQEEGERLARESRVTLRFASDFTQDILMEVVRVGEPENGQAVVVLSTDRCLEQTTLLRRQTAELIFDSRTGLRVPKGAVRMIDGTRTDEETGETTQYNTLGVYVVTAGRAEFKPVEILAEGDEFYVVRSVNQDRKALRAGDEVVIRGTGLYDGKLLKF